MSNSGFTKKRLALTIILGTGEFGKTVGSTVTLSDLRMTANIVMAAGDYQDTAQLRVFGLTQPMMNQLTTIGTDPKALLEKNKVVLAAGDDRFGMQTVYEGSIITAWADYGSTPEVVFNVTSQAAGIAALKPVEPISINSPSVDVAKIVGGLAKTMGLAFEHNNVSVQLAYPYYDGTALEQLRLCVKEANIRYTIDRGVLAIWPKNGARAGQIPLISPATGMVGYPVFSSNGINITSVFNPNVQVGKQIQVDSSLTMACGTWEIDHVSHSLSSEIPGGPWFTTMDGHAKR
jgi:hypothetical protein